jgi:CcmD family protein
MTGGQYLAAAYAVVFVFLLAYVAIIAAKLSRLQRETRELVELARSLRPEPRVAEPLARETTSPA